MGWYNAAIWCVCFICAIPIMGLIVIWIGNWIERRKNKDKIVYIYGRWH